jgi:hypothetical protein
MKCLIDKVSLLLSVHDSERPKFRERAPDVVELLA